MMKETIFFFLFFFTPPALGVVSLTLT